MDAVVAAELVRTEPNFITLATTCRTRAAPNSFATTQRHRLALIHAAMSDPCASLRQNGGGQAEWPSDCEVKPSRTATKCFRNLPVGCSAACLSRY